MTKIRVLFVEDEKDLVDDLPVVLGHLGFDVIGTSDLQEAQRLFKEMSFDVVLTDVAMPPSADMDIKGVAYGRESGIELARRFHEEKPTVPIVALTVMRDTNMLKRMREAGIVKVVKAMTNAISRSNKCYCRNMI